MKVFVPPAASPPSDIKIAPAGPALGKSTEAEETQDFQRLLDRAERAANRPAERERQQEPVPAPDSSPKAGPKDDAATTEEPSAEITSQDETTADVSLTPHATTNASLPVATEGGSSAELSGEVDVAAKPKLTLRPPSPATTTAADEASQEQAAADEPVDATKVSSVKPQAADAALSEQAVQPPGRRSAQTTAAVTEAPVTPPAAHSAAQPGAQSGPVEAQELPTANAAADETETNSRQQNDSPDQQDRGSQEKVNLPPQADAAPAARVTSGVQVDVPSAQGGDASTIAPAAQALDTSGGEAARQPHETATIQAKSAAEQTAAGVRDEHRVAEQAMRAMRTVINQRGGSLTLRLNPPELGELRIRLEMQQHTVTARFEAANEMVRQLLQQQLPQLHSALSSHGFMVEQIQVQVHSGGANPQAPDGQDQPNDGRSRGSFEDAPGRERDAKRQREQLTRFQRELLDVVG